MSNASPFKWYHFKAEIILQCVRWYPRYALSYRDRAFFLARKQHSSKWMVLHKMSQPLVFGSSMRYTLE
jgi:transposase-like protein